MSRGPSVLAAQVPSDLNPFYATTATVLSAVLIASVLELRHARSRATNGGVRMPLMQRIAFTSVAVIVALGGIALGSIPHLMLGGEPSFYNDPQRLASFTALAVGVALLSPLMTLVSLVWSRDDGDAARGDATSDTGSRPRACAGSSSEGPGTRGGPGRPSRLSRLGPIGRLGLIAMMAVVVLRGRRRK